MGFPKARMVLRKVAELIEQAAGKYCNYSICFMHK
jgi:hypothetical protein